MPKIKVVYTDLDGTLLDHNTYSFKPAAQALGLIREKSVPLVICTSKTRAEIEFYRRLIGNKEPFISENGGGIFIPEGYFEKDFEYQRETNGYKVIEFGTPSETLIEALRTISTETGIEIKGFSQMSAQELSEITGLDEHTAKLSQTRDYSEPFLILGDDEQTEAKNTETIVEKINLMGYRHTKGGRFHHILGKNDKGRAVATLNTLFQNEFGDVKSIGLGDSLNDLPMLNVVDIPVLVQKPDGSYDAKIKLANLLYADAPGPYGWNSEILKLFMNS